jgi:hypothetical protein
MIEVAIGKNLSMFIDAIVMDVCLLHLIGDPLNGAPFGLNLTKPLISRRC